MAIVPVSVNVESKKQSEYLMKVSVVNIFGKGSYLEYIGWFEKNFLYFVDKYSL